MITHNMHDALTLGNRTLMMDHGRIVLDISGEERAHTTVDGLLDRFAENVGHALDNDRIFAEQRVVKNAPHEKIVQGGFFTVTR